MNKLTSLALKLAAACTAVTAPFATASAQQAQTAQSAQNDREWGAGAIGVSRSGPNVSVYLRDRDNRPDLANRITIQPNGHFIVPEVQTNSDGTTVITERTLTPGTTEHHNVLELAQAWNEEYLDSIERQHADRGYWQPYERAVVQTVLGSAIAMDIYDARTSARHQFVVGVNYEAFYVLRRAISVAQAAEQNAGRNASMSNYQQERGRARTLELCNTAAGMPQNQRAMDILNGPQCGGLEGLCATATTVYEQIKTGESEAILRERCGGAPPRSRP